MKKLVYICSPLRGDYENNIDNAIGYSRMAFKMGYIPITPHIYFTRFMDDENSKERSMAMDAGIQLLLMCSEVWVFGLDNPSEGMRAEIAEAIRNNIPIRDGEKVLADQRRKMAHPIMTTDIVERHVEWLTKNFGPVIAARWKKTNQKYAADMQMVGESASRAGLSLEILCGTLTDDAGEKGAGHDGRTTL